MERPEILRPCDRNECRFSHRHEYCEPEGQDINGGVIVVADMLDELLYSNQGAAYADLTRIPLEGGNLFLRTFSLPDNEAVITLQHFQEKALSHQNYDIMVDWIGGSTPLADEPYRIEYAIELWPGKAHATITEHNLTMTSFHNPKVFDTNDRPMTPYDHERLFDLLAEIYDMEKGTDHRKPVSDGRIEN